MNTNNHKNQPFIATLPGSAIVVVLATAVFTAMQLSHPGLLGFDGYYHIKMAALTLSEGLPIPFPYLSFTVLENDRFWDMHMLFHVFQAPFTLLDDLGLAAKVSTAFWAAAAFGTMYWILRRYEVPLPYLWVIVLLAASEGFLYRMGMPRAQVFGVIYTFIAFHLLMQRRVVWLGILAVLFVWTYKGFLILIPITLFGMVAHYLESRRIEYGLFAAAVAGIAAGLVINPYFPNDVMFLGRDVLEKILAASYETNVGGEWFPYDTRELIAQAGIAMVAFLVGLALTSPREWQHDKAQVFWALTAALWFVMLLRSQRFVEYFPPAAVMLLAFSCKSWLQRVDVAGRIRSPVMATASVAVVLALGALGYGNLQGVRADLAFEPPIDAYKGGAGWLAENTPAGSRVFHTDWDDFPMLFFHNSHNTYIVGLDPDYMRIKNPELYDFWSSLSVGRVTRDPGKAIRQVFEAEYVFTDRAHESFIRLADRSGEFVKEYSDSHTVVYRVVPPPGSSEGGQGPAVVPEKPRGSAPEPPSWW